MAANRVVGVSQHNSAPLAYVRYADFLAAHPGRRGDALELGHDWRDGNDRYRVCWYGGTGELTIERLDPDAEPALEDFYEGVAGPVEVIGRFPTRADLERALGPWPNPGLGRPRTLAALRELAAQSAVPSPRGGASH